jgi:glycosyltransferase involved in cell wall biosynthesis
VVGPATDETGRIALMQQEKTLKVSVCVITYNQDKYIRQCLQSIVDQKTNFSFEVIVGDDCSLDGTRAVVREFVDKYPNIVNPIFRDKNIGPINNFSDVLTVANGKYIAVCEGDDYWIDSLKLQKQFDFMNNNLGYSMCFHNARIEYDDGSDRKSQLFNPADQKKILYLTDIINKWQIPSASMFYRRDLLELPGWFNQIYNGDYALQLLLSGKGPIGYIPEVMSVYRKHPSSLGGVIHSDPGFYQRQSIELFLHLQHYYKDKSVEHQIRKRIKKLKRSIIYQKLKKRYPFLLYIAHLKRYMMSKW